MRSLARYPNQLRSACIQTLGSTQSGLGALLISGLAFLSLTLLAAGTVRGTSEKGVPSKRVTVAVLWFEDRTGDPQSAHWRYGFKRLLTDQLKQISAIRPRGGVEFARHHLGLRKGAPLDASQARKMGELIEAQRVIWGNYQRHADKWQVSAYILNVASGLPSDELSASSADWFELRDTLIEQILKELCVIPSKKERQEMARRWTTSPAALEWYSKAIALQEEQKPLLEQERIAHKAIESDPQFVKAYGAVAATLFSQGKLAQAEQFARQALKIRPDCAYAHIVLGISLLHQGKPAEAEQKLREAHRLEPDEVETLISLGEFYANQQKWDEAITFLGKAKLLDPMSAKIHAALGLTYAYKRDRNKAIVELKEAERLDTEGWAEIALGQAYARLGEIPLAVEHYEKIVTLYKNTGVNPKMVADFEERARQLKARLSPTTIEASMPKVYTEQALQTALRERLTENELEMVVNPLASSSEIKRWAQQLAEGAGSDLDKAKVLFDSLKRRLQPGGGRGARTAREVFAAWSDPNESFTCQEYAKLYVALARDVGIKAFYAHIDKDYRGKNMSHDCAVVFVDGRALLVDVTFYWFGVPHKEYVILDDVQAVAHHLFQHRRTGRNVSRCRLAAKLHPDFAWGQLALVSALCKAEKWEEARKALEVAAGLEPEHWGIYLMQGVLANRDDNLEAAVSYFRKALNLNPEDADSHYYLGSTLLRQVKLQEAREQYRACLRYKPEPDIAESARREIAQINEAIGDEQTSGPTDATAYLYRGAAHFNKGLYDEAISDFTKAIEINPEYADGYTNRGAAYAKIRLYELAISDFTRALEINPEDSDGYVNRGIAYAEIRLYDLAISDITKAIEINPRNARAHFGRGEIYCNFKANYDAAILDFTKVIEINPRHALAYRNRGKAYIAKGEYDRAIQDCNKAIELNPDYAAAYRTRGAAYKAKVEDDKAKSDLNKFKEISKKEPQPVKVTGKAKLRPTGEPNFLSVDLSSFYNRPHSSVMVGGNDNASFKTWFAQDRVSADGVPFHVLRSGNDVLVSKNNTQNIYEIEGLDTSAKTLHFLVWGYMNPTEPAQLRITFSDGTVQECALALTEWTLGVPPKTFDFENTVRSFDHATVAHQIINVAHPEKTITSIASISGKYGLIAITLER